MREVMTIFAPASIGNLSVGFDALGLALAPMDGTLLGDLIQLRSQEKGADWALQLDGPFAPDLPLNPADNVVLSSCLAYQAAAADKGVEIRPLKLRLSKRLPIGSGLGSSASSIVATLEALNRWHDNLLSTGENYRLMARMEKGLTGDILLDNVAASLFGGLRLCPPGGLREYALPWPGAWRAVVCWPGTRLETREARSVLPDEFPMKTAVQYGANFAEFVHALHSGNTSRAAECVVDAIAEPHRSRLLPGFEEAKAVLPGLGALAVGISGSGPTIFALVDDFEAANRVKCWMDEHYRKNDRGFVHVCRADLGGARSVEQEG